MDTAAMLVARTRSTLVLADLARVDGGLRAARRRAPRHADGRPHAAPAGAADDVRAQGGGLARRAARARERLVARPRRASRPSSAAPRDARGARRARAWRSYALADELGLAEPVVPWHTNRRGSPSSAPRSRSPQASLAKIALDLALLAQTEVGEVREGGGARRVLDAAPQAEPDRVDAGVALRPPRLRLRVGPARARSSPGARTRGRRLARRVGGALGRARATRAAPRRASREASTGSRSTRSACARTSTLTGGLVLAERVSFRSPSASVGGEAHDARPRRRARRPPPPGARSRTRWRDDERRRTPADERGRALDPTSYVGSAEALVDRALERPPAEAAKQRDARTTARRPGRRAGARPRELARHDAGAVGRASRRARQALPRRPLRPARATARSPLPDGSPTRRRTSAARRRLLDQLEIERASFCGLSLGGRWAWGSRSSARPRRPARALLHAAASARRRAVDRAGGRSCARRAWRPSRTRCSSAGSRRSSPTAVRRSSARFRAMLESTAGRGLRGVLRGDRATGTARRARADRGPDAVVAGEPTTRHAAERRASSRRVDPGRALAIIERRARTSRTSSSPSGRPRACSSSCGPTSRGAA